MGKKGLGNVETAKRQGDADFIVADVPANPRCQASIENQGTDHRHMSIITCWMTPEMTVGIERLVRAGHYITRSDAIRAAIHKLLSEEGIGW